MMIFPHQKFGKYLTFARSMMFKRIYTFFVAAFMLTSCGEYQEVLKSKDLDFKLAKAFEYYDAKEYAKAFPIFDELIILVWPLTTSLIHKPFLFITAKYNLSFEN